MGGNIYSHGNTVNYLAEFNFYHDPEAAFMVLQRYSPHVITRIDAVFYKIQTSVPNLTTKLFFCTAIFILSQECKNMPTFHFLIIEQKYVLLI